MIQTERTSVSHFFIVLAVVFCCESLMMYTLPMVLPHGTPWFVETLIDALGLTLLTAPALWILAVRPWRAMAKSRRDVLAFMFREQEEERRRIARNLHDELGQSVTSILVCLRNAEQASTPHMVQDSLNAIRKIASDMTDDYRRLARGLRPAVLDDFGLAAALQRLADDLQIQSDLTLDLEIEPLKDRRFPNDIEIELFRIIQEALTNVVRHAGVDRATVRGFIDQYGLHLIINDRGRGFDPEVERSPDTALHIGLSSMRERALLLNGQLELRSSPDKGTTVEVMVPLPETAHG